MTAYTKEEQLRDYGPDSHFARLERLERKRLEGYAAVHRDRRERIATACMAGILSDPGNEGLSSSILASWAVECADALIAELDKPKEVQP